MKLLLDRRGVGPSRPSKDGWVPLRRATVGGHEGVLGYYFTGMMSALIVQIRMIKHHSGGLLLRNMKGQSSFFWGGMCQPQSPDKSNRTLLGCASVRGHLVLKIIDAEVMIGGKGFMRQSGTA